MLKRQTEKRRVSRGEGESDAPLQVPVRRRLDYALVVSHLQLQCLHLFYQSVIFDACTEAQRTLAVFHISADDGFAERNTKLSDQPFPQTCGIELPWCAPVGGKKEECATAEGIVVVDPVSLEFRDQLLLAGQKLLLFDPDQAELVDAILIVFVHSVCHGALSLSRIGGAVLHLAPRCRSS